MKLYRGFVNPEEIQDIMTTLKNRVPRNLDHEIHKLADDYFYKKFGIRFRSQSVFCTGDLQEAKKFGEVRVIEPIGDYVICWSPKVNDFMEIEDCLYGTLEEAVEEFIEKNDYQLGNLEDAINSKYEIMLFCEKYKVLPIYESGVEC